MTLLDVLVESSDLKIVSEMTYNVSGGTLNHTIAYHPS